MTPCDTRGFEGTQAERSIICFRIDWGCICIYTYTAVRASQSHSRRSFYRRFVATVKGCSNAQRSTPHLGSKRYVFVCQIHTTYNSSDTRNELQIQRQFAEICRITKTQKAGLLLHTKPPPDFTRALFLRSYDRKTPLFLVLPIKTLGVKKKTHGQNANKAIILKARGHHLR